MQRSQKSQGNWCPVRETCFVCILVSIYSSWFLILSIQQKRWISLYNLIHMETCQWMFKIKLKEEGSKILLCNDNNGSRFITRRAFGATLLLNHIKVDGNINWSIHANVRWNLIVTLFYWVNFWYSLFWHKSL